MPNYGDNPFAGFLPSDEYWDQNMYYWNDPTNFGATGTYGFPSEAGGNGAGAGSGSNMSTSNGFDYGSFGSGLFGDIGTLFGLGSSGGGGSGSSAGGGSSANGLLGLLALGTGAYGLSRLGGSGSTAPTPMNLQQQALATQAAQLALAPVQYSNYNQFSGLYGQTDLRNLQNNLFGNVDTQRFLAQHPEFKDAFDAAVAAGQDGQAWLNNAVSNSSYIDQGTVPRGGGLLGVNQALTNAANQQSATSNTAQRVADLNDVANLGGQSQQAYQNANSQLFGWRNAISDNALRGISQTPAYQQMAQMAATGPTMASATALRDIAGGTQAPMVAGPAGYQNVRAPGAVQNVGAMLVNPNTGFNRVQAQQGDIGLMAATNRMLTGGPSDIQSTLEQQARAGLAAGQSLTPEEQRNAQQAAREGWASRGLINSNGSVAAEVLNRDAAARARESQRQAFAQSVDATGFGQRQQGFANALGVSNAAQNYAGMGLSAQQSNLAAQLAGNTLGFQGQTANQDAALRAALANQSQAQTTNQFGLQAQLSNQSAGLTNNAQTLQAGLANQQSQLSTNSLNQNAQLANQQADAQRNAIALQFLNRNDLASQNQFNQLGATNSAEQQRVAQQNAWYQQAFNNFGATQYDPFASVLGRSSTNQGSNNSLFGQSGATTANNQNVVNQFNPFNTYAQNLYDTNYNANAAANINAGNRSSALTGSLIGLAGQLGGAYLSGSCWVARECLGTKDGRWTLFRDWLLTRAPRWFRALYLKHGESFAEWLRPHHGLKRIIARWMESRIETLNTQ